jgi:7-carboxy-7-deazaguanine synthase
VDPRVVKVMDIKTPGSGESSKNRYQNIGYLNEQDQIKFVICDHQDYLWAKTQMQRHELTRRCEVLFSPAYKQLKARKLADWILEDHLNVRFQIQLHKSLWGDVPGH